MVFHRSCWKSSYVYICCVIASVGGVLFGYDIGWRVCVCVCVCVMCVYAYLTSLHSLTHFPNLLPHPSLNPSPAPFHSTCSLTPSHTLTPHPPPHSHLHSSLLRYHRRSSLTVDRRVLLDRLGEGGGRQFSSCGSLRWFTDRRLV